LYPKYTKHEITLAMNIIEEFVNLSGLKLNKNKTEGIWQGRLKHTKDKYENITWTNEPIESLGVYFGMLERRLKLKPDTPVLSLEKP
jgi:hypothetical protein